MDVSKYPDQYWHCYVLLRGSKEDADGIVNDLAAAQIRDQIVEPWRKRTPFNVAGVIVRSPDQVTKIRIVQTPDSQSQYAARHRAETSASGIVDLATNRRLLPFREGTDYTSELLFGTDAPAVASAELESQETTESPPAKAFIVHGHETAIRSEVARFLESVGTEPVILMERAHLGRTLIEKLEQHRNVEYAVILCTADDVGRANDGEALRPRPRQNVVLELGYFIGVLGRENVCVLMAEGLDMPSDFHGVGYVPIDQAGAWKLALAKEMRAAGLEIDLNKLG